MYELNNELYTIEKGFILLKSPIYIDILNTIIKEIITILNIWLLNILLVVIQINDIVNKYSVINIILKIISNISE